MACQRVCFRIMVTNRLNCLCYVIWVFFSRTDTGITASVILMLIVRRDKLILCKGRRVSC